MEFESVVKNEKYSSVKKNKIRCLQIACFAFKVITLNYIKLCSFQEVSMLHYGACLNNGELKKNFFIEFFFKLEDNCFTMLC